MCTTCLTHVILPGSVILITHGGEFKLRCSFLCKLLYPSPITSSEPVLLEIMHRSLNTAIIYVWFLLPPQTGLKETGVRSSCQKFLFLIIWQCSQLEDWDLHDGILTRSAQGGVSVDSCSSYWSDPCHLVVSLTEIGFPSAWLEKETGLFTVYKHTNIRGCFGDEFLNSLDTDIVLIFSSDVHSSGCLSVQALCLIIGCNLQNKRKLSF
jgi:hypothetical protein